MKHWLTLFALLTATTTRAGTTIIVAPPITGAPSDSLQRTIDAARSDGRPVTVYLHGGLYLLSKPLVLGPQNSGITLAACRNELPVISGGRRITGWQSAGDGLWSANVPDGLVFHELWINGDRRIRSRHPNTGYLAVAETLDKGQWTDGVTRFRFKEGDLRTWPSLTNAEIIVMNRWAESRLPVAGVDETEHIVTFGKRSLFQLDPGDLYYIENCRETLDAPGEWYLADGKLLYRPLPGEDMAKAEVIAPGLAQVVRLEGAERVTLRGLTFAHTEWYFPADFKGGWPRPDVQGFCQAAFGVPGAVVGEYIRQCQFENCTFIHLGNYGLELGRGCQSNRVTGCKFADLGAGGIKIGEPVIREKVAEQTFANEVTDCRIYDGGKLFHSAIGIWIGQSYGNRLAHNLIHDFYYSGISIGWTWGYGPALGHSNVVEWNQIHHIGKLATGDGPILSDMAGIYTLGKQPGTVIRNNVWHDIAALRYGGWGIYFDEGSSGIVAENNLVYRTTHGGFHQHYGATNVVRNNIFAFARDHQLQRSRVEEHLSFTFERNIVYWDAGKLYQGDWSNKVRVASNLYWRADGKFTDPQLVVADPLFVAPGKDDFTLRRGPPALKLGFKPFNLRDAGPRH